MKPPNKTRMRIHAKHRAKQRYGLNLNRHLRREIIRIIQAGDSVWHRQLSRTRTVHVIDRESLGWFAVIYSNSLKDIVTVLPRDAWQIDDYTKGKHGHS